MRCPMCQETIKPFLVLGADVTRRLGFAAAVLGAGVVLDLVGGFGSITSGRGSIALGAAALGRLVVVVLGFWQLALHSHHRSSARLWQDLARGLMIFALFMMGMWARELNTTMFGSGR